MYNIVYYNISHVMRQAKRKGMKNGGWLNVCKVRCKFPQRSQMTQSRGGATGFCHKDE